MLRRCARQLLVASPWTAGARILARVPDSSSVLVSARPLQLLARSLHQERPLHTPSAEASVASAAASVMPRANRRRQAGANSRCSVPLCAQRRGCSSVNGSSKAAAKLGRAKLEGRCGCGSVGWTAFGSSLCRAASGNESLAATSFNPEQLVWHNQEGMKASQPPGSKNIRYHCASCGEYVGEDARASLGVLAVPVSSIAQEQCPAAHAPNMHIFYGSRTRDATDGLPKWETLPYGSVVEAGQHESRAPGHDSLTGRFHKDVALLSSLQSPEPLTYTFTESDPGTNRRTFIPAEKVPERVAHKYHPSPGAYAAPASRARDVIIIGGGHNALVSAAYLARKGLDVLVLERRHVVGGAAITEELVPGFKFSRASYLAGLLRPQIIKELGLESHGFKYLPRDPSSFTPTTMDSPYGGASLMLGSCPDRNRASIAQFSTQDADAFERYEAFLGQVREVVSPLLDGPPPTAPANLVEGMHTTDQLRRLVKVGYQHREVLVPFYELFTAPASHILDRWFESQMLKTTLATDAVIGAMTSPTQAGSAYVLLHHVMGEAAGKKGVWAYVEGGMGAVSTAIAQSATDAGAEIVTNAAVQRILYDDSAGRAKVTGVLMQDGTKLEAATVLSGTTPYHTFLELLPGLSRDSGNAQEESPLPHDFVRHIRHADYSCGAFKINCAVNKLPNFECMPSNANGTPGPQHRGTVHFESHMDEIENAYREASLGIPATRPVIEMTIPSALDSTISPPGKHVVQLFVQFAPYDVNPKVGSWADPAFKESFVHRCFSIVDEFAPGFSSSIIGYDALSPLDLERIFGLHKGNIFHGSLSLHQLAHARPVPGYSSHRTPLQGLYMCASGTHPGGGVMGAAGRNCARIVLSDRGTRMQ